jgi:phosphohistidine phosphatase
MRIYLTQHGLAVPKEVDTACPLSDQGRRDIQRLADFLGRSGVHVDRILHSGKVRAEQTAGILADLLRSAGQAMARDGLGPKDAVQSLGTEIETWTSDTLIVSHMPLLGRLASHLLISDPDRPLLAFQPGSTAGLERDSEGRWQLVAFVRPELVFADRD